MTDDETTVGPEPDAAPEGWQGITDDALASWALDKIRAARAERARLRENARDYLERVQARALADEAPLTDRIEFFEGHLISYYDSLDDPPKTYRLPNGQIKVRAGRDSTRVVEAEAFLSWADTWCPDAVDRKPRVSALKEWQRSDGRVVSPDGEPVPGVEVVRGEPSYSVVTEGGGS